MKIIFFGNMIFQYVIYKALKRYEGPLWKVGWDGFLIIKLEKKRFLGALFLLLFFSEVYVI